MLRIGKRLKPPNKKSAPHQVDPKLSLFRKFNNLYKQKIQRKKKNRKSWRIKIGLSSKRSKNLKRKMKKFCKTIGMKSVGLRRNMKN